MAGAQETILLKIDGDSSSGEKALDRMTKKLESTAQKWQRVFDQIGKIGKRLTIGGTALTGILAKLGEAGTGIENIEKKFAKAMAAFGFDADQMLVAWDKAARGAIDRVELMKKANFLALTGVPVEEMGWMLEAVANAADATGISFAYLYEKLAGGLAKKSKQQLDELGIIISVTEANEAYAQSIGKTVDQLNAQDQVLAFVAAAREAAKHQEEVLGKSVESNATKVQRGRAAWQNMMNDIKKAFIPVAVKLANIITKVSKVWAMIPQPIKEAGAQLVASAAAFAAVLGPVMILIGAWPRISSLFGGTTGLIKLLTGSVGKLFLSIRGGLLGGATGLWSFLRNIPSLIGRLPALIGLIGKKLGNLVFLVQYAAVAISDLGVKGIVMKLATLLSGGLKALPKLIGKLLLNLTSVIATAAPIIAVIAAVAAAIGIIVAAVIVARKAWEENWAGIRDTVRKAIELVKSILDEIAGDIRYWIGAIKEELAGIMAAVRALVEPALARLNAAFDGSFLRSFLTTLKDAVNVALGLVRGLLESIRLLLEGESDKAMEPLEDAALNVVTLIVLGWRKYIQPMFRWGWNLLTSFAQGVVDAAKSVLKQAATFVGNMLSRFFKGHSPPPEGPLRFIAQWGQGVMNTFLKAFGTADFGILRDVLSPMRDALEASVDMGELSRPEMLELFGSLRQQAAQLIANFRETGQISDEMLQGIADSLGEGGAEYAKYLRLTLEHEQALNRLKDVQNEVAEAEKRGFVPAELKAKLDAAQQEADAAAEAVEWQKEYLAALQDGVDLQREMIDAIKELNETIKGTGDLVTDEEGGLDTGGDKGDEEGGLDFSGFSEEFESVKAEVKDWFDTLPERISEWTAKIKERVSLWWEDTKAQLRLNLLMIGAILAAKLLELITKIRTTLLMIWAIIVGKAYLIYLKVRTTLLMIAAIILGKLLIFRQNIVDWWTTLVNITIPHWFLVTKIKIKNKLEEIRLWLYGKWLLARLWLEGLVTTITTLAENIAAGFWQGLKNKWEAIKSWWDTHFGGMGKQAEETYESHSPSGVFERIGASIPAGFAIGLRNGFDMSGIQQTMGRLFSGLTGAAAGAGIGAGGVLVIQIGDMSMPGIRDGRDAGSFVEELTRLSDNASLKSVLPGGKMG